MKRSRHKLLKPVAARAMRGLSKAQLGDLLVHLAKRLQIGPEATDLTFIDWLYDSYAPVAEARKERWPNDSWRKARAVVSKMDKAPVHGYGSMGNVPRLH